MLDNEHSPHTVLNWPMVGVLSTIMLGWGAVVWRGGGLVWRGASRMKSLEEAVSRLEIADREGDKANKQGLEALKSEFREFRKEFAEARKERDAELKVISDRQDHVSTRIHERMDMLSQSMNRVEGYLQAKAEK